MKYGTVSDYDTFVKYLAAASPINQAIEGRLTFHYEDEPSQNFAHSVELNFLLLLNLIFFLFMKEIYGQDLFCRNIQ